MGNPIPVVNAFIEDTCVLMVIAYVLARGKTLTLLFSGKSTVRGDLFLGLVFGLAGLTEVIFPGARAPYMTHTLVVSFSTLLGGLRVGIFTSAAVSIGSFVVHRSILSASGTALTLAASVLLSELVRRIFGGRWIMLRGLTAGMLSQAGAILVNQMPGAMFHPYHSFRIAVFGVPANGFGLMVFQIIVNDARMRADSERHRLAAERANALVSVAQLTALRARVHPHFLFNTLNSIAALCGSEPARAENAILRLSQLMRRALEANPAAPIKLADEVECVRGYLEIEQNRLGARLTVIWTGMDEIGTVMTPAFSVQTLVENSVLHGIAPRVEPGAIDIIVRRRTRYTLIAVRDNGVGMNSETRAQALASDPNREHGLHITAQQLLLLNGASGRLHLFSSEDRGTLVAFAVPTTENLPAADLRQSRPPAAFSSGSDELSIAGN